jgi:hypothetical protein
MSKVREFLQEQDEMIIFIPSWQRNDCEIRGGVVDGGKDRTEAGVAMRLMKGPDALELPHYCSSQFRDNCLCK